MREAVKDLLQKRFSITRSYKEGISDWYQKAELYTIETPFGLKFIHHTPTSYRGYYDIDVAVDTFLTMVLSENNVGYIQERLVVKGLISEVTHDLEHPSDELKALFRVEGNLVREEFEALNIPTHAMPSEEDALFELSQITNITNLEEFKEALVPFVRAYAPLDIYMNFSFIYGYDNDEHKFSSSIGFESFDKLNIKKYMNMTTNDGGKFEKIQFTVKVGRNGEHHKFDLDFKID